MIFLAKKISIFSVSSFAHMSLLSCECPVVLNFSSGQGKAGQGRRVGCGAGQPVSPLVGEPIPAKYISMKYSLFCLFLFEHHHCCDYMARL